MSFDAGEGSLWGFPRRRNTSNIFSIQMGNCGNRIGAKFWEIISNEHGIAPDGIYKGDSETELENINVYFKEINEEKYHPRAVLVDLEPNTLDLIRSSSYGKLFQSDKFVSGENGTGINWARGYFGNGAKVTDEVLEIIRREAENIDRLQGFHLIHSMGGGTGSGLGAHVITKLRDQYPCRIMSSFSVFPSLQMPKAAVEPYNVMLSMADFIENSDETICIDNEALYKIYWRKIANVWPTFDNLNSSVSMMMSGVTSLLRFSGPCRWNFNLYNLASNMIPYPKHRFLMPSFASLNDNISEKTVQSSLHTVVQDLFDNRDVVINSNPRNDYCLPSIAIFRGTVQIKDVEREIAKIRNESLYSIPENVRLYVCDIPTHGSTISGTFLENTTAVGEMFGKFTKQFTAMFRHKAFLHFYQEEGIEEEQFKEALYEMENLISEYEKDPDNMQ